MLLEALKYDNRIFGLDPQLVFQVAFQMLAIFILFLAASYLLLDPVRKILNDRKERVFLPRYGAVHPHKAFRSPPGPEIQS